MPDFPINVKVDPGDSKTKIEDVHRTVDKAEKSASAATRAFQTLGDAVRYMANTTVTQAVKGFNSLTDAIQLEHRWMTTIRGDIQGYSKDVAALNALMARGKITAREYDAALSSAGRKHGLADATPGGFGKALGGAAAEQLTAIAGPAALAATAIGAVAASLDSISRKAEEFRNASVAMLKYKGDAEAAAAATANLRSTSALLGANIEQTTGAFLGVAGATDGLGLSQDKLTDITRGLGLAMLKANASIGDTEGVLGQLEAAIKRGSISGGELHSIMKRFDALGDIWEKSFGKSRKELLAMADNGELAKLGLDKLITSIRTTPELLGYMEQRLKLTLSAQTMMTGEWQRSMYALQLLKLNLPQTTEEVKKLGEASAFVGDTMGAMSKVMMQIGNDPWGENLVAKAENWLGKVAQANQKAIEKAKALREELKKLANAQAKTLTDELVQRLEYEQNFPGNKATNQEWADFASGQNNQRLAEVARQRSLDAAEWGKWMAYSKHESSEFESILVNAFEHSELSFSKMVDSFISDLTRLALRKAALGLGSLLFGGDSGNAIAAARSSGFGGGLFGSAGLDYKVPHFGAGGGMRIPGTGATDRTPVMFWGTGGEHLSISTPGQQMSERQVSAPAAASSAPTPVIAVIDPRAIMQVLRSPLGAQVIDDVFRRNPGLLKR